MMYAFSTDAAEGYPLLAAACTLDRYFANHVDQRKPLPECRVMSFQPISGVDLKEALETVFDDAVVMGW